jgi:5'-3' exonuclease
MDIHLVDGTYELFRHFHAVPSSRDADGREVGAVRAVVGSVLGMITAGATHIAVATDHIIESFRNRLWSGYKTGAGIEPDLRAQFTPLEEALASAGIVVWPMVEFEADDALAAAAAAAERDPRVDRIIICTPDKDLAQCVRGTRVVQLNRRTRTIRDEAGVIAKFGVPPASIPDYLALVGDAADGYPGLAGWGAKSTAAVLARFGHIESIPDDWRDWHAVVEPLCRLIEREPADLPQGMLGEDRDRRHRPARRDGKVRHDPVRAAAQVFDRRNEADVDGALMEQTRAFRGHVVAQIEPRRNVETVDQRPGIQIPDGAQANASRTAHCAETSDVARRKQQCTESATRSVGC